MLLLPTKYEPKIQYNVKLHQSTIDYINAQAEEHGTTGTNVVRYALNLIERLTELNTELEAIDQYKATADNDIDRQYKDSETTLLLKYGLLEKIYDPDYPIEYTIDEDDHLSELEKEAFNMEYTSLQKEIKAKYDLLAEEILQKGYAIREKFADVIKHLPKTPQAPFNNVSKK